MKRLQILKKDYYMNESDIKFIKSCGDKFHLDINKDFLYSSTIDDVLKNSINEIDYKLNWVKKDTLLKLWFLTYILIPINEAVNYKDLFKVVYNQQSLDLVCRNSILLMFNNRL